MRSASRTCQGTSVAPRLTLLLLLLLAGPSPSSQAAELTTERLRDAAARQLAQQPPRELSSRVRLEPAMFTCDQGQVRVVAQPLRPLAADEASRVLEQLDRWLIQILSTGARGKSALLSSAEARQTALRSTIAFGPVLQQRRLGEVTNGEVLETLHAYIDDLNRRGAWEREPYQSLAAKVTLRRGAGLGPEVPLLDSPFEGRLAWTVAATREESLRPFLPPLPRNLAALELRARRQRLTDADRQRLRELHDEIVNGVQRFLASADLKSLVAEALTEFTVPGRGVPLLESSQRANLEVDTQLAALPSEYERASHIGEVRAAAPGVETQERPGGISQRGSRLRWSEATPIQVADTPPVERTYPANTTVPPTDALLICDSGGFQGAVTALAFSPDGSRLAAAGDVVRIWDLPTGTLLQTLRVPLGFSGIGGVTDVKFTPSGRELLVSVAGTRQSLQLYDLAEPAEPREVLAAHDGHVTRLAFSPRGDWLVTAGADRVVALWDWPARRKVRAWRFQNPISSLQFPHNEYAVAINSQSVMAALPRPLTDQDREFGGFLVDPPEALFAIRLPDDQWLHPFATASTDGARFAAVGGYQALGENRYRYWCRTYSAVARGSSSQEAEVSHSYMLTSCTLDRDGQRCASADETGRILVWNAKTGKIDREFLPQARPTYSVAFGDLATQWRFGREIDRAAWARNRYAPLQWEFDLPARRLRPLTPAQPVEAVSRVGDLSVTFRAGTRPGFSDGPRRPAELSVTRDGQPLSRLPFTSDQQWDLLWYSMIRGPEGGLGPGVVAGDEVGSLTWYDPRTLLPRRHFVGHRTRVWGAAESRGTQAGRYLISAGGDGTLRVWSLEHPQSLYNVPVVCDNDNVVTYVYPATEASGKLRPGDLLLTIDGLPPREWVHDPRARRAPSGPVPIGVRREGVEQTLELTLSNLGDLVLPLLSAVVDPATDQWLVWTSGGYYDGSPGAEGWLGWHQNRGAGRAASFVAATQLNAQFRRPDVIDLVLELGSEELAVQEADRRRRRLLEGAPVPPATTPTPPPAAADPANPQRPANPLSATAAAVLPPRSPPRVQFLEPQPSSPQYTYAEEIEVVVRVEAQGEERPEVDFVVNGARFQGRSARPETDPQAAAPAAGSPSRAWVYRQRIPLVVRVNHVAAVAREEGLESDPGTAYVIVQRRSLPEEQRPPGLHLLTVGVNATGGQQRPLEWAKADSEKLRDAFSKLPGKRYRIQPPMSLVDQRADAAGIRRAFDDLARQAAPGDTVVIHLSAHGDCDSLGNYYLLPFGGDLQRAQSTCIPWSDFLALAQRLRNVRLLLFLDTCRSAAVTEAARDAVGTEVLNPRLGTVFAACGARQVSLERADWGHGAFSLALLEALQNRPHASVPWANGMRPDLSNDGTLTIEELSQFLRDRVKQLTGEQQVPDYCKPRTGVDPILFEIPPPETAPASNAG